MRRLSSRPLYALPLLAALLLTACATTPPPASRSDVEQLLTLQKTRLDVATPVARSKWNSHAPIDDPVREAVILDDVAARAQKLGLDAAWTRRFFQDQFEAGKIVQRDLHRQWRVEQRPPFTNPPDLALQVRPVLDRLTPDLLAALARLNGHWCEPAVQRDLAELEPEILGADYAPAVRARATEALRCQH
ncbi:MULTISPECIES: gamma subclass chorismate mutase AroQ [unclassified Herbaspirillum]|uniref:gamma subclass chorismate mutase AroQ n=1 Tax=unclassified Herbaspirillum TaxID=2624150 RepID=UPI00054CD7C5|nr:MULTISPECIES: gamma subclass chorismate mutase AroQ [unclassified Herbaspirillum]MCI1004508.1 gamma subclass chorismate mutase AroQ [Herbaspirillum sp. C7C8]